MGHFANNRNRDYIIILSFSHRRPNHRERERESQVREKEKIEPSDFIMNLGKFASSSSLKSLQHGGQQIRTAYNGSRLPRTRVLYTVIRGPHVHKSSREQFEMRINRQYLELKAEPHELRKKLFWLKRFRLL